MMTEMTDCNFDGACTSPCISAPSSPQYFGTTFFFSTPTSPTRISKIYQETNDDVVYDDTNDYAFEFSGHEMEKSSVTAAGELFDGGKIKPKPVLSFESKQKEKEIESIAEANELRDDDGRGRERNQHSKLSSSGSRRHKTTRSLSTMRVADLLLIDENDKKSASESCMSSSTEELNKYALVKKARQENVKKVGLSSTRRRKGPISAHELHYKMKRDVLKEMKKKTFLPYKRSVLSWHGCYGLDDTISMYMIRPQ
ncbi:hypothetical protein T459_23789 [Capsicum annuum]|uniref:Uncharacterized protein n=1 Tax=Capsicum annuum TaxID=4072 RepID=A0A2G2YTI4_CAPAN|nr:hypothetical protein T459_23789 [Capsicum annuum]